MIFYKSIALLLPGVIWLTVSLPLRAAAEPTWREKWQKTTEAAKHEGTVIIHASRAATVVFQSETLQKKLFPEINLVIIPSAPDPNMRIITERRAGKYLADVVIGGASTTFDLYRANVLDPIKDALILPEVVDESKWWRGKHQYSDPEQRYGFNYIGVTQAGYVRYNSRLVNPKEFQSFLDFLNPKWKGKMQALDARAPGGRITTLRLFYLMPGLGGNYIHRLFSEMEITPFRDHRQAVDWLVTGKYPLCFNCSSSEIGRAQKQGFPVATLGRMKEGVGYSTGGGSLALLNRAPHPNAAKVFINRLLSGEAQLLVQTEYAMAMHSGGNSLRIDIPKDMVPPESRLIEGIHYVNADGPEYASIDPVVMKIYNEALAESERRARSAR